MVLNEVARRGVYFRYSSDYDGDVNQFVCNYLRRVEFVYGNGKETAMNWAAYHSNNSLSSNLTIDYSINLTYDESGRLAAVKDSTSNQKIAYTWDSGKVKSVSEYSDSTLGQSITFDYKTGVTELRSSGNDDIISNEDDVITRYVFDSLGRSIAIYSTSVSGDQIYGATTGKYDTGENSKNNIKEQMTLGGAGVNYLLNADFDEYVNNTFTHWTKNGSVLKKWVRCVEEDIHRAEIEKKRKAYEENSKHDASAPKFKEVEFKRDPSLHHFYIDEDKKYAAAVKFDSKGTNVVSAILVILISIIICAFLCYVVPDMLTLFDNFVSSFNGNDKYL